MAQSDGVTVFIPVYNEEQLLESSVEKVHRFLEERTITHEIIVVDNGSIDSTAQIGQKLAARHDWFRFFTTSERGIGRAFCVAVREARFESIVSLDVDLPTDLIFIEYAKDLLKHGDLIVGSKSMGNQRRALPRILGSQFYILAAQLFFRLTVSDYAPSTKAFRRSVILPALPNLDPWTGYVFELCIYCRLHARRVIQIGVDCEDLRKSRFNLLHEGLYRYRHLYQCARLLRNKQSWFYITGD